MEVTYVIDGAGRKSATTISILPLPPAEIPSSTSSKMETKKRNHIRSFKKIWNNHVLRPRKSTSSLSDTAGDGPIIWNASSHASVLLDKQDIVTPIDLYGSKITSEYEPDVISLGSGTSSSDTMVENRSLDHLPSVVEQFAANPVRIIITPPADDEPTDFDRFYGVGGNRSNLSFSSARSISETRSTILAGDYLDSSRLMPLAEHHINRIRERKAIEFREVRKWLVQFLNERGDQFPPKLRYTLMKLYGINECDIVPEMVARFSSDEIQDEGVALDCKENNAESLKMLAACFQSQLPQYGLQVENTTLKRSQSLSGVQTRSDQSRRPILQSRFSVTRPAADQYSKEILTYHTRGSLAHYYPQPTITRIPSNPYVPGSTILPPKRGAVRYPKTFASKRERDDYIIAKSQEKKLQDARQHARSKRSSVAEILGW
ncbi:hypothetical protein F5884DRAFT_791026 [Xylogone sp. PMI_703]|nr:hypothetical protein F5884DRAFT_791026 [Xylogone sp. PMI_703]